MPIRLYFSKTVLAELLCAAVGPEPAVPSAFKANIAKHIPLYRRMICSPSARCVRTTRAYSARRTPVDPWRLAAAGGVAPAGNEFLSRRARFDDARAILLYAVDGVDRLPVARAADG